MALSLVLSLKIGLTTLLSVVIIIRLYPAKYWWLAWAYGMCGSSLLATQYLVKVVFGVVFKRGVVGTDIADAAVFGGMAVLAGLTSFFLGRRRLRGLIKKYAAARDSSRPIDDATAREIKLLSSLYGEFGMSTPSPWAVMMVWWE